MSDISKESKDTSNLKCSPQESNTTTSPRIRAQEALGSQRWDLFSPQSPTSLCQKTALRRLYSHQISLSNQESSPWPSYEEEAREMFSKKNISGPKLVSSTIKTLKQLTDQSSDLVHTKNIKALLSAKKSKICPEIVLEVPKTIDSQTGSPS